MSLNQVKAVEAHLDGKKVRGIYRQESGTFTVQRGAVTITVPEYIYSFDFKVAGTRYRSVFGRESEHGRIGANGKWQSTAIEAAAKSLVQYKNNAKLGSGPTSVKEEQEIARKEEERRKKAARQEKTIADLVPLFLEDIALSNKPRTVQEYKLNLERDIIPALGAEKVKEVTREDITSVIKTIVRRKAIIQANRTISACSRLFSWALDNGQVDYNPCTRMKKYKETARNRTLTEKEKKSQIKALPKHDEIKQLWEALETINRQESRILQLCIIFGSRPGEICNMKWSQIDDDNWWSVEGEDTKTGEPIDCYLSETALGIIGERNSSEYVFPLYNDNSKPLPVDRLSRFVRNHKYFGLKAWQPRDLRRTFTTLSKGFGFPDLIINIAQARTDSSVLRKHYDQRRYYIDLRKLFETIEGEILRITGHERAPGRLIKLHR